MHKRIAFIALNTFSYTPIVRFIVKHFANYELEITELTIKGAYSFSKFGKHNIIKEFEDARSFNNQSFGFKLKKYWAIITCLFRILSGNKPTYIYASDFQVLSIAFLLNKFLKNSQIKFIYHQFELIDDSKFSRENLYFYKQFLKYSHKIDLLIIPEKNRAEYLLSVSKIHPKRVFILPNTCEHNDSPTSKHEVLKTIPEDAFIFGHIGNFGFDHYAENFLKVARAFKDKNVYFLFVGRQKPEISEYIKKLNNPKIILIKEVPHSALASVYPFIDVGFVLYKGIDKNFEFCAPNKLYEYWSYGVPVVGHRLGGLIPVFTNQKLGQLVNMEDSEELYKVMSEYSEKGRADKKLLKKYFKETLAIRYFLPLLEERILSL